MHPSEKQYTDLIETLKENCGDPVDERFFTHFPKKNGLWITKPSTTIDALKAAISGLAVSEGEHEPMVADDVLVMLHDALARAEEDRDFVRMTYVKSMNGDLREAMNETARRWDVDSDIDVFPF